MHRFLLIAVTLGAPLLCGAASRSWEAFDYANCRHWQITDDYQGKGKPYEKAVEVAGSLRAPTPESPWLVLYGFRMFEEADAQYGVCLTQYENNDLRITCDLGTAFPLAGATFVQKKPQTLVCSKGCENIPFSILYQMGYEDGGNSDEYARAAQRFERQCQEKHRAKMFFERRRNKS